MSLNTIGVPYLKIHFSKQDANTALVSVSAPTDMDVNSALSYISIGLSFINEKTKHTWEYEEGFVDAMEYIFNKHTQTLPIGLLPKVKKYLLEKYKNIRITVSDDIRSIYTNPIGNLTDEKTREYMASLNCKNREHGTVITAYDHQVDIVREAINGRRISIMACTSAGKSLCIMAIARWTVEVERRKTLIITPSSQLVEQLYGDFYDDYGWDDAADRVTLIHGTSKDKLTNSKKAKLAELGLGEEVVLRDITISTWQSLQNKPMSFFKGFNAVIVDEAHGTRGPVLRDILDKCVNAIDFKVGLSGTLPDEGLDSAWIEGALGKKLEVIRLKHLIARGILTPVDVVAIRVPIKKEFRPKICNSMNYKTEYAMVTTNGSRIAVCDLLIDSNKVTENQNTLILFKTIVNLEVVMEHIEEKYPQFNCHKVIGEIKATERNDIRRGIETSTGNIIFATYGTFKQGVNIKLLHNLIFAEFSKSPYEVVQALGRIVRPHPDKDRCTVYDIFDDASYYTKPRGRGFPQYKQNYSSKHYLVRNQYYVDDEIPIVEYGLEGIYEASISQESLDKLKKKAAQRAAKKKTSKKKIQKRDDFDF
jgi:superfamily II DNA or RNA helicase